MVVIVNKFHTDAQEKLDMMVKLAMEAGADDAVMCEHTARGGPDANLTTVVNTVCA